MKLSPTFWVTVAVVVGAAVLMFTQGLHSPSGPVEVAKIRTAAATYAQQLKAEGKPLPGEVALNQLLMLGLLEPSDVSGFEGAKVTISLGLRPEDVGQVLMRVRLPEGKELVALNDGSVQERPTR